ncbi:zinc finger protein 197-like isoform X2 [Pieris napi]|uniref:zinc finger protein 197-like isoform X2 n=1 Tax=Pieris napi TaxID=78633 RepID=UPI001FB9EC25|nr:zinc finger protein 197-like isoform X2 [Pieris napi]
MMEPESEKEINIYSEIHRPTKYFMTPKFEIKDTLTSKDAVKFLLDGTLRLRVCKYCLNITPNLNELDEIIVVAGKCGLYEVTIKDIVASFYPVKVSCDTNFPNKICSDCLDRAFQCYLFTQQCDQAGRALHNYLEDLNDKFNKLDPMEPLKRRGKPKLYFNHNVLNMECKNVIDYAEPVINLINLNALPNNSELTELECPKCWQVLPNITSLVNHEKSHPKSMWYYCKQCGKAFVKYTQLKKHKRNEHSVKIEDIKLEKYIFTCKQCGISNESLSKHLLHVEKHSFTKTLGELIMNPKGNCAMCFNKAYNMVYLNETMHMHGGGAGLMGEKSISNIVTTVFPDKSYTYRECSIPTCPSNLHVIKCKVDISGKSIKKMKIDLGNTQLKIINIECVKRFLFSKPQSDIDRIFANINNKENRDSIFKHSKLINADVAINKYENETSFKSCQELIKPDLTENAINLSEEAVADETRVKNIFQSYLEPILTENYKLKVGENNYRNCNICWVFKKPTCLSCKQYIMKTHEFQNEERELQKKSCNSCYIFSKVGFCDVCHNIVEVDKDHNKKMVVSDETIDKTTVWLCNICLRNNINTETCICCEENRTQNKYVKNVVNVRNMFTATLPYEIIKENHLPVKDVEGMPTNSKSTETLKQLNNTDSHNKKLASYSSSAESPMDIEMDLPIYEEEMYFEENYITLLS